MAIGTIGTTATSSLIALKFGTDDLSTGLSVPGTSFMAQIQQAILNDITVAPAVAQQWPGAFSRTGVLYIPNRGVLYAKPGDIVAVDATTGWPVLISGANFASGAWNHFTSPT